MIAPGAECITICLNAPVRNLTYSERDISPDAWRNSRCLMEPRPDTCPAIFTLYGTSANTPRARLCAIAISKKDLVAIFIKRITAKQAVVAEKPEIARLRNGGTFGHGEFVGYVAVRRIFQRLNSQIDLR